MKRKFLKFSQAATTRCPNCAASIFPGMDLSSKTACRDAAQTLVSCMEKTSPCVQGGGKMMECLQKGDLGDCEVRLWKWHRVVYAAPFLDKMDLYPIEGMLKRSAAIDSLWKTASFSYEKTFLLVFDCFNPCEGRTTRLFRMSQGTIRHANQNKGPKVQRYRMNGTFSSSSSVESIRGRKPPCSFFCRRQPPIYWSRALF